ncbi:MAG TPA: hypothetical protein VFP08_02475 [Acidimicrobiales bacterium]|nr:hypothetical protein [Acidimicrobiales bacterium]
MVVAGQRVEAPGGAAGRDPTAARRQDRRWVGLAMVLVLLPIVATLVGLIGDAWHPSGDRALEVVRMGEVGGGHTPLTGAWSRFDWDHPGPLLFWLVAPFTWVFGLMGALIGVGVANAAALAGSLVVAHRRGGREATVLVAVVLLALCAGLGNDLLIDPWNPWVAVLPFFTYMLLAWSIADLDLRVLPYMVVVGTFAVQAHVGYAALVVGIGACAGLLAWWSATSRGTVTEPVEARPRVTGVRRTVLISIAVGVGLWLPPIIQQITGDHGNLGELLAYARDPGEPFAGWRTAWGIMGTEVGFPGGWLAGGDDGFFGTTTSSAVPAMLLLLMTAAVGWAATRRGSPSAGRLATLALLATGLGVVSTARITGPMWNYVMRWWWVIAAVVWLSVAWSTWSLVRHTRARTVIVGASLAAGAILSITLVWRGTSVRLPEEIHSAAVAELADELDQSLDEDARYLLDWVDRRDWGGVGMGLFLDLRRRGLSVSVPQGESSAFDPWHTARADQVDSRLVVVASDDLLSAAVPPPDAMLVAQHDPLSARQRARSEMLRRDILRAAGIGNGASPERSEAVFERAMLGLEGVDRAMVDELLALRQRGSAYSVFVVPEA